VDVGQNPKKHKQREESVILRKYLTLCAFAFAISLFSFFSAAGTATAEDPYFKGKTITLLVGYDSGQTDLTARTFARHLETAIEGNPTVIVKNMAGGGTMKAQNFLYEIAEPDGLTIGFNPFLVMAQLTEAPGLRFKYQDATFVAGILTAPFMSVARADVAPGGVPDTKAGPLRYTGRHPMNIIDITATTALDVLGVDYLYVGGHRGDSAIAKSLEQSETQITGSTLSAWKNFQSRMVDNGDLSKLYYHRRKGPDGKYVDDPNYKGWKNFHDVYREVHNKEPSGELWEAYDFATEMLSTATWVVAGPPKMNSKAAAALRDGFAKVTADAAFQAEAAKAVGNELSYVGQDQSSKALERLKTVDAKTAEFWKQRAKKLAQ
jgi:tripartite-type tricarboxylate transporter receptor subunit TctC